MESSLLAAGSLKEFFRTLLEEVARRQQLQIADVTEFYLVNLLSEFVSIDKLYQQDDEGRKNEEPLAVMYHRAQLQQRDERIRTLRQLGDISLYKAGFFQDALRESVVGADYYIQMGGAAYGQVAELSAASGFSTAYAELCRKFRAVVDVLSEIAAHGLASSGASGALKVYESWARTGSEKLERVLVDVGFIGRKTGLVN